MKLIWVIAVNSFKEYLRDRLVLSSVFIAAALFLVSLLLGNLSFSEQQRIMTHLGLTAIHISGLFLVSFLGAFVLHKEIERQTCLLVLARPVNREHFLMGKWLGVWLLLVSVWALLGVLLYLLLLAQISGGSYMVTLWGILLEMSALLSVAFFASTVVRPAVALFAVIGVYLIGNWLEEMQFFAKKSENFIFISLAKVVNYVTPHFYQMNWRSYTLIEKNMVDVPVVWSTIHALAWIGLLLLLAQFFFRRKDLA